ncbi:MAG: transketolase [Betaproteobacteria bacterium]|nr:transketolase [Betaproteobacteria bacterium]
MATRSDLCNAIRALAMDAVQQANSGHPGMPMGMAEIAEVVWRHHLRHNPANPSWINRDRFVISNGHGSMLLYALLHLSGYDLPMAELRRFRQLNSKTPGHPEYGLTPGVETTTGPLGQGLANAVGMAIAERVLAAQFNRPGVELIDHRTYVFCGDGCLMEGISHEACSLAGTLGLGKLIGFYDDNSISIDSEKGNIRSWFSDDTPARFRAYGWNVIGPVDGHDSEAIERAVQAAQAVNDRPSLIVCKTIIAKGAPHKANTGAAHGAPLGADEVAATRANIGWSYPPFEIPADIYADWDARERGRKLERDWQQQLSRYADEYPAEAAELRRRLAGELPADWARRSRELVQQTIAKRETVATRKASQNVLEALLPQLPELIGGSADLAASNLTMASTSKPISRGGGNYIFYGVREFGMCAIANGLALHGGLIPYVGTFLVFSDYARNALRMAALMHQRLVFVFTHDSVGLGEDGPTHQPIEHAATLRLIPRMDVWRPCDSTETAVAWIAALERRDGPTSLQLSRQNLAFNARSDETVQAIARGGYVLVDADGGKPAAILIATGSEVALAVAAREKLAAAGVPVRVVSMPSTSVFDRQDAAYRETVLLRGIPRLALEAGVPDYWRKYVGLEGDVIGIDRFGESAPGADVFKFLGFTVDNVVARTQALVGG